MSLYYLPVTGFLYLGNLKSNEDALIKYLYNQECNVNYNSTSFHHFPWEKNTIIYSVSLLAWNVGR